METVEKKTEQSSNSKNNNVLHVNIILRRKNSHNANITWKIRYQHDKNLKKDMSSSFAQCMLDTDLYNIFLFYTPLLCIPEEDQMNFQLVVR